MVFIIKATYNGETRRWTQEDTFPSFQHLSDQIHRTFRNIDNFYIAGVTFSPTADTLDTSSGALVGNDIRSADDWNTTAAAQLGKTYPSGVLKLTLQDELAHRKVLNRLPSWNSSMELDAEPAVARDHVTSAAAQTSGPSSPASSCCSVSAARSDIKGMMDNFLKDFTRTMSDTFGDHVSPRDSPIEPMSLQNTPLGQPRPLSPVATMPGAFNAAAVSAPVVHDGIVCDHCNTTVKGIRYKCKNCADFDLCQDCMGDNDNGAAIHSAHFDEEHEFRTIPVPLRRLASLFNAHPRATTQPAEESRPVHNAYCDVCRKTIVGSRHKCLDCPDFDMCDTCIVEKREKHNMDHQFYELNEPGRVIIHNVDRPFPHQGPYGVPPPPHPMPHHHHPHRRHSGVPHGHHPFHNRHSRSDGPHHPPPFPFPFPHHPGRGFTHPVPFPPPPPPPPPHIPGMHIPAMPPVVPGAAASDRPAAPIVHNATCDLCDSKILGNRYKCTMCPDYDVCESCYSIVGEQHPVHAFLRIKDPKDIMIKPHHISGRVTHNARCDSCGKQIYGARFKCLHPTCPDFDLCMNCEALPIDVHPASHALVKLKMPIGTYEGLPKLFKYTREMEAELRSTRVPTVIRQIMEADGAGSSTTPQPTFQAPRLPGVLPPRCDLSVLQPFVVTTPPHEAFPPVASPSSPAPSESMAEVRTAAPVSVSITSKSTSLIGLPHWLNEDGGSSTPSHHSSVVVLEGEGEREEFPSSTTRSSPRTGQLVDLTDHLSINAQGDDPFVVTPIVAESSPFADENAVRDSASSLKAPSVVSLASSVSASIIDQHPTAAFVADNNIPDGHVMAAGTTFIKSWKLRNDGHVAWPERTRLLFSGGDRMGTSPSDELLVGGGTQPGVVVDISVELRAPTIAGKYASFWRLKDDEGRPFGHRIWCDITVVEEAQAGSDTSLSSSSVIMPVPASAIAPSVTPQSPVVQMPGGALASPTISSLPSEVDVDEVGSESGVSEMWEDASRAESPDQFVLVYESSNEAATDSDEN